MKVASNWEKPDDFQGTAAGRAVGMTSERCDWGG